MATLFGKPGLINENAATDSTIDIQLCGYGSRSPVGRGVGGETGVIMDVSLLGIQPTGPNNTFNIPLIGNDYIAPPGTYYTVTIRNANGDILQTNAYVFLDENTYDLAGTDPFDPALPMPPLPPLIYNQLQNVDPAAPWFECGSYTAFQMTLDRDVEGAALQPPTPGNLYTFIIVQDAAGGHIFWWPNGMTNFSEICSAPNSTTVQLFIADDTGMLWAVSAATWYIPPSTQEASRAETV